MLLFFFSEYNSKFHLEKNILSGAEKQHIKNPPKRVTISKTQ